MLCGGGRSRGHRWCGCSRRVRARGGHRRLPRRGRRGERCDGCRSGWFRLRGWSRRGRRHDRRFLRRRRGCGGRRRGGRCHRRGRTGRRGRRRGRSRRRLRRSQKVFLQHQWRETETGISPAGRHKGAVLIIHAFDAGINFALGIDEIAALSDQASAPPFQRQQLFVSLHRAKADGVHLRHSGAMSRVGKSCSVVQDENHGQHDRNEPVFHVSTPIKPMFCLLFKKKRQSRTSVLGWT